MFARSVSAVNCVLMLHADVPLPVGKIAKAADLAYAPARSAIETLEKRGLVVRTQRAGQDEFSPDLQSPYHPAAYLAAWSTCRSSLRSGRRDHCTRPTPMARFLASAVATQHPMWTSS